MAVDDAIVNPFRGRHSPEIGPLAILVSNADDLDRLAAQWGADKKRASDLYMGEAYVCDTPMGSCTLAGPFIGAPYGVMLLETLIAWGARKIVFFGWCGAISPQVSIGDIIVPTGAFIDEGTSPHYCRIEDAPVRPATPFTGKIKTVLEDRGHAFHEGDIWTTDGIYRETREKVTYYQGKRALAVEMELSAVYTVGNFRNVAVGAVLVVSDALSSLTWRPGFGEKRFNASRRIICDAIGDLCRKPPETME